MIDFPAWLQREPGCDDAPEMSARESSCGCHHAPGEYGAHGYHWRVNPEDPERRQADICLGFCPPYQAKVKRQRIERAARDAKRKQPKSEVYV